MIEVRTEGYSQSWKMEDPEPVFEDDMTEEIEKNIYKMETEAGGAVFIYNDDEEVMDIIGSRSAALDARQEYWQEFGAYENATNGVEESYSLGQDVESAEAAEALREFGVEVEKVEKIPVSGD